MANTKKKTNLNKICDILIILNALLVIILVMQAISLGYYTHYAPKPYKNPNVYILKLNKPTVQHIGSANEKITYDITLTRHEEVKHKYYAEIKKITKNVTVNEHTYNTLKKLNTKKIIYTKTDGFSSIKEADLKTQPHSPTALHVIFKITLIIFEGFFILGVVCLKISSNHNHQKKT